jgi:hypothetical protein
MTSEWLRGLGQRRVLDLDFMVLAAMGAAHVERRETQRCFSVLDVLDPGIDLTTGVRTKKSDSTHRPQLPQLRAQIPRNCGNIWFEAHAAMELRRAVASASEEDVT